MTNPKTNIKLLIPALLLGLSVSAGAAEGARQDPAGKHPLAQRHVITKINRTATAAEGGIQSASDRGHDGVNSDAGVPPSGVPSETMDA